jgi:NADH dehydrogenase
MYSKSIKTAFAEADKENSGHLTLAALRSILEKADKKIRALPATAQVAHQQGRYVADLLNQIPHFQSMNNEQKNVNIITWVH